MAIADRELADAEMLGVDALQHIDDARQTCFGLAARDQALWLSSKERSGRGGRNLIAWRANFS